ncbi:hypothetical protein NECAME_11801 [Necator americanus]|uniref:Uncharacterized protein n=1 Tax=Necator americanus TaxID=51031 RepID=W2T305_NECAM|nr:hypothetical protein NECAME_11801 [Necator americanus]ETN76263.1 hypothetical protein NECAME_11801 [Necator americanus]
MDGLSRHNEIGKSPSLLILLKAVGSDVKFFTRSSEGNFGVEITNYDVVVGCKTARSPEKKTFGKGNPANAKT